MGLVCAINSCFHLIFVEFNVYKCVFLFQPFLLCVNGKQS